METNQYNGKNYIIHYGVAGRSGRYKSGSQNNAGNIHRYEYINGIPHVVNEETGTFKRTTIKPEDWEEHNTGGGITKKIPSSYHMSRDKKLEIAAQNVEDWEKTTGRRFNNPEDRQKAVMENYLYNDKLLKERQPTDDRATSMNKIRERNHKENESRKSDFEKLTDTVIKNVSKTVRRIGNTITRYLFGKAAF